MFDTSTRHWTVRELMRVTIDHLQQRGLDEARLTVELLLAHVLRRPRIELYTGFELAVQPAELEAFRQVLLRRLRGEPVQYIVGSAHFMGLSLRVDPRVLIPRPETETLVEWVMLWAKEQSSDRPLRLLDVGTGCGNIAVAAAKYVKQLQVVGVDVHPGSLEVARTNVNDYGLADRVEMMEWDLFEPPPEWLRRSSDVVASNPPYIPLVDWETLEPHVRLQEPQRALTDGADGMRCIRRIIEATPDLLRHGGPLVMEVGHDQAAEVMRLCDAAGAVQIRSHRDLQQIERVVSAWFEPRSIQP